MDPVNVPNAIIHADQSDGGPCIMHSLGYIDVMANENQSIQIGTDRTLSVVGNETITIGQNHTITLENGNMTVKISGGNLDHDVTDGTSKHHVKGSVTEVCDDVRSTRAAKQIFIISDNEGITVQANTQIVLRVGASEILIDNNGITLNAAQINITGTSTVAIQGDNGVTTNSDASMTVSAAGVIKITGGPEVNVTATTVNVNQ